MFKLIFLLLLGHVYSLYENADVVRLTPRNFDKLVTNSPDTWVVQFYSSYCPYCQDFAPEFEKAATVLRNTVKIGVVDSDSDKDLLRRFDVHSIPAVKIYHANKKEPEDYTGPRTVSGLVEKVSEYANKSTKRKLQERKKIFASESGEQDNYFKK